VGYKLIIYLLFISILFYKVKTMTTQNIDLQNTLDAMFSTLAVDNILKSFDKGQGNTAPIVDKLYFSDSLTLDYLNGTYKLKFQSLEHLQAYFTMLFYRDIKDRSTENLDKLFKHINNGTYLSLNHTDNNSQTVSVDKYAQFKTLFDSLGIVEVKSNGKGSKLTQLICEPTAETVTTLSVNGFENITPLIEAFAVIGLKVELPKSEG
jgi:hypothetical protein